MVHEGGRMLHGDRMQCGHQSHVCVCCIYTLYIPPVGGVPMVGVLVV